MLRKLREIARTQDMIVLASIHQPSKDVFQTFDDLLLLYQSGRKIFCGPIVDSESVARRLSPPCGQQENLVEQPLHVAKEPSYITFVSKPVGHSDRSAPLLRLCIKKNDITRSPPKHHLVNAHALLKAFLDLTSAYAVRAIMFLGLALLVGTVWPQ